MLAHILWAADAAGETIEWLPPEFYGKLWGGFLLTLVYGLLGIVLAVLGFKVFDWITPRIHIQQELSEKHNVAVAIVVAAIVLGICHIVATAVHG
jgi:putative membrane protein